jgi:hypothetical protein
MNRPGTICCSTTWGITRDRDSAAPPQIVLVIVLDFPFLLR